MNPEPLKSDAEWKAWLRARLLGSGPFVPPVDRGKDEDPFDEPARLWKTGREEIRIPLRRAILELLEEVAVDPWPAEPSEQLTRLIESIELWEAVGRMEAIVGRQPRNAMQVRALRTLLGLGWHGRPQFWEQQVPTLGREWPALVFSGLAAHGLDLAFRHLPKLASDARRMRDILDLWPSLVRQHGLAPLHDRAEAALARLPQDSRQLLMGWIQHQTPPPHPSIQETNLRCALSQFRPRSMSPRLAPA